MTKKKLTREEQLKELVFPCKKFGKYEFFALRNPLELSKLKPLVDDFLSRLRGELSEGKTSDAILQDLLVHMVNKNPKVNVFVAVNTENQRYVGFLTSKMTMSPPPPKIWLDEFHFDKGHCENAGKPAREFYKFFEAWVKKTGFSELHCGVLDKKLVKAFQRLGYSSYCLVLKKKIK